MGDLLTVKQFENYYEALLKTQKNKIQICCKFNTSITLNTISEASIFDLKCLIYLKLGLPPFSYVLIYSGINLQENKKVSDYGLENKSTCFIVMRLCGGGIAPILFSNLQKPVFLKFSSSAPRYRTVDQGLNLAGTCMNLRCSAMTQNVWCIRKFGKFILNKQLKKLKCPECSQFLQKVENIGLYLCKATFQGIKTSGQQIRKIYTTKKQMLLTFQDKDQTKCEWNYLEVNVEPLK